MEQVILNTQKDTATQNHRKTFVGNVVSTKMNKTIVVEIERKYSHPRFKKLVIVHKKFHVHDEKEEAKLGDKVKIIQTRPLSKTKFYRLLTIMEKAK